MFLTKSFNLFGLSLIGIILLGLNSSCSKGLEELNENPNAVEQLTPEYLFTNSVLTVLSTAPRARRNNIMHYMQEEATYSILNAPGDKYISIGNTSDTWALYGTTLSWLKEIMDFIKDDPDQINKLAIARIWKVYTFHQLTDMFGDIPYSEANMAIEGNYTPKYDLQSEIYKDFFKELEEAANSLNSSKESYGGSDIVFSGNVDKWRKFAYSLMLRLGMRLTKIDLDQAKYWVEKAIAGGLILDDEDLAKVQYTDGSLVSNRNPVSVHWMDEDYIDPQNVQNVLGSKISKRFIDYLKGNLTTTKDPRLNSIAVVWVPDHNTGLNVADTSSALQKGLENGKYDAMPDDYPEMSEPNPKTVMSYGAPIPIMTSAENYFLLTEAAIRGWYSGDPIILYEKGVRAAMRQWALYGADAVISEDKIDFYISNNPFKASGTFDEQLEQICNQKWVLFYVDQFENFANWRRTGYPKLIPVNYPGNITGGKIPRRAIVPSSEEIRNPDNYWDARNRQSGDNSLLSRVWWDKE